MVMPVSVPVKLLPPKPSSQGFANSVAAAPSARDKPASSVSDDEMPVLVRMTLSPPHSPQGAAPRPPAVSRCSAPPAWGGDLPLLSRRRGTAAPGPPTWAQAWLGPDGCLGVSHPCPQCLLPSKHLPLYRADGLG